MRKHAIFKVGFVFFMSFATNSSWGQMDYQWVEKRSLTIDSSGIWSVDVFENVYLTKKDVIHKFDSIATLKFSQSQKSIGRLSALLPVNTMKIVVFSEEQQLFCFLDNTLTPYESCIELIDKNIGNGTLVAVSAQPDKLWVYDQLNSRLHLLSLSETDQSQEIQNLTGILNSLHVSKIVEQNNFLYVVDFDWGVYVLDMYGSLIEGIKRPNIKGLQVEGRRMFFLEEGHVTIIDSESKEETEINCPLEKVIDFRIRGNNFYFRTKTEIKKYELLFNK
jgi:hypothetical protein